MDTIKIGLLGCGTVGSGVVKLLAKNATEIALKTGSRLEIKKILVKDPLKKRDGSIPADILTTKADDILEDPEIKIVVELIGGIEPAKDYILKSLEQGKNVVTANKDVLAAHGQDIFKLANEKGKDLLFEGSVGGGIPIILPLRSSLAGNKISRILGIVNGTTNYILTKMSMENREFSEALAEAQALGYAEADPSADVDGLDAARKIAILASIAFQTDISIDDVYVEGITGISSFDIVYAKELGFVIKLLGVATEKTEGIEVRVHPVMLPVTHPLAAVNDVFNAVFIEGDGVGQAMFFGPGAGEFPTASSIIGDLMLVAKHLKLGVTGKLTECKFLYEKSVLPIGELISSYYIRLLVLDQPGVLAKIAGILADHKVSIASVLQKRTLDDLAEIVLVTHQVKEANFSDALNRIRAIPFVKAVDSVIRVDLSSNK
ncbi:MAG: homoserine dehydrogenase [Bacillota bacterium]